MVLRVSKRCASTGELSFLDTDLGSTFSKSEVHLDGNLPHFKPLKGCLSTNDLLYSSSLSLKNPSRGRNAAKITKTVSFHRIEINEIERALGDHPCVSAGPALSLGKAQLGETTCLPLEDYERLRPERRSKGQLKVPRNIREDMLQQQAGVTKREMLAVTRETMEIKRSRQRNSKPTNGILKLGTKPIRALGKILKGSEKDEELNRLLEQGMKADEIRKQLTLQYEEQIRLEQQQEQQQQQQEEPADKADQAENVGSIQEKSLAPRTRRTQPCECATRASSNRGGISR